MEKIVVKGIKNDENFNQINLQKSEIFLDNIQQLLLDIGLVDEADLSYEYEGKRYDITTYYNILIEEDHKDTSNIVQRKRSIDELNERIVRYKNEDIELLLMFFANQTVLIFHCDEDKRKEVNAALEKFCQFSR